MLCVLQRLNAEIGALIGRKLADFDVMDAEIQDCRRHWLNVCEESFRDRQTSMEKLIEYSYTAMVLNHDEVPNAPSQVWNVCLGVKTPWDPLRPLAVLL